MARHLIRRAPGLSAQQIDQLVQRYELELARYEKAADQVAAVLARSLRDGAIQHLLAFRAKHPDGLREKLFRRRFEYDLAALRGSLNSVVTDLAGCRVVVYRPADEAIVEKLVRQILVIAPPESDAGPRDDPKTGYKATHLVVCVPEGNRSTHAAVCEVQICSLARHLHNEIEHDIRYKTPDGSPSREEIDALDSLLTNVKLTDKLATAVFDAKARNIARHEDIEVVEDLRFALEQRVGRSLRGDFARLHLILEGTLADLTAAALDSLDPVETMTRGESLAQTLGIDDTDDVVHFVLGLWDEYQDEISVIAASWRGRKSVLAKAIETAKANSDEDANG